MATQVLEVDQVEKGVPDMGITPIQAQPVTSAKLIYTIGHSTHPLGSFVASLRHHSISTLVDVRTSPYSRYVPRFNANVFEKTLRSVGVSYIKMGEELGGRPENREMYGPDGKADYSRMSSSSSFLRGIARLKQIAETECVALMCSEEDPNQCHRWLLIGEHLRLDGYTIHNIRSRGRDEIWPAKSAPEPGLHPTQPLLFAEV